MIDFSILVVAMPALLRGTLVSLAIATGACLLGLTLGTLFAFMHQSSNKFLSTPVAIYVTIMRGTPMLIQIPFFCYYIFPAFGLHLPLAAMAALAIGLNSGAYISQIVRSGISSVHHGQFEAARMLGFSGWQTIWYIILPQAIATITPALLSEFIILIKDSSLASTIGVYELFKEGSIIISRTYNAIPIYCAIAAIYLTLTASLSFLVTRLERRTRRYVSH
jgi:glutamine transport system permease protein